MGEAADERQTGRRDKVGRVTARRGGDKASSSGWVGEVGDEACPSPALPPSQCPAVQGLKYHTKPAQAVSSSCSPPSLPASLFFLSFS